LRPEKLQARVPLRNFVMTQRFRPRISERKGDHRCNYYFNVSLTG